MSLASTYHYETALSWGGFPFVACASWVIFGWWLLRSARWMSKGFRLYAWPRLMMR